MGPTNQHVVQSNDLHKSVTALITLGVTLRVLGACCTCAVSMFAQLRRHPWDQLRDQPVRTHVTAGLALIDSLDAVSMCHTTIG